MRDIHEHNARHATQDTVTLNRYKTAFYGTHSIKHQSVLIWIQMKNEALSDLLQKSRYEKRDYIINKLISIIKIIMTTLISLAIYYITKSKSIKSVKATKTLFKITITQMPLH